MTIGTGRWTAQTLRHDSALAELADEWEDLYRRCSRATPFQSHAWLDSWWRSYGRPGGLVLTLVRRGGRLVGAAALARRGRGTAALRLVGAGVSDYGDVLIDDGCAGQAGYLLARQLAAAAGRGVIDLAEVRPGAAVWQLLAAWPGRSWLLPATTCLEMPGRPLEEIVTALSSKNVRKRRRELHRVLASGIDGSLCPADRAAGAVDDLLVLHRQQWRDRGMTPEHGRARFAEHLARATSTMVRRGQAVVMEFRQDGRLVAADILMIAPGMVGAYLYGIEPALRDRTDVLALLLRHDLDLTCQLGRPVLSLMRGDEPHKRRWRPREVRNQRVLLAGRTVRPPYVAPVRVGARLGGLVRRRLPVLHRAGKRVRRWLTSST